MSHLRKLQRNKQTRINGIKYAPLIHDPNLAHCVALSNLRESKKLSERIKEIEQQREKCQHLTEQAEQVLRDATKGIVKTYGTVKKESKEYQLPNIVLTKADAKRSKLPSATTFALSPRKSVSDIMNLLLKDKKQNYSRPRANSAPYLPTIGDESGETGSNTNLSIPRTAEYGLQTTKQSKSADDKTRDSPSLANVRRLSESAAHLTLRKQLQNSQDRRASDSKLEELKKKDLIVKLTNEQRRKEERQRLINSEDRRKSLFLSLPLKSRPLIYRAARPSISIMETVEEDTETESSPALSRSSSRARSETT